MNKRSLAVGGTIALAALTRLLPHPPNLTPIVAIALFSGACLSNRRMAILLPIGAMVLSDMVLSFVYGVASLVAQPVVYLCIVATVVIGRFVKGRASAVNVAIAATASSIVFYAVTNFAEWAFTYRYSKSLDGLIACYAAAIPFFRNSFAGDMIFTAILFGAFALLQKGVPSLRAPDELLAA